MGLVPVADMSSESSSPTTSGKLVPMESAVSTQEPIKLGLGEKLADMVTGGMISKGKQIQQNALSGKEGEKAQVLAGGLQQLQSDMKMAGEIGQSVLLANAASSVAVARNLPSVAKTIFSGMAAAQAFDYNTVGDRVKATVLAGGISAAGDALVGKVISKLSGKASTAKLPSSQQVEESIQQVTKDTDALIDKATEFSDTTAKRADFSSKQRVLEDKIKINDLEVQKTAVADRQAILTQKELVPQASKKLNQAFEADYIEAAKGKTVPASDIHESLETVLQNNGVVDSGGKLIGDVEKLSPQQKSVYDLYKNYEGRVLNEDTVSLMTFDKELKGILPRGKQFGSADHILAEVRMATTDVVSDLRDVGKKYAEYFQYRNEAMDTFKSLQTRSGYRHGSAEVKQGMDYLKNLAHDDPAQVLPQNQRVMKFIEKYTGVNPSEPVVEIGAKIKGIRQAAEQDLQSIAYSVDEVSQKVKNSIGSIGRSRDAALETFNTMKQDALKQEAQKAARLSLGKKIGWFAAGAGASAIGIPSAIKRLVPQ